MVDDTAVSTLGVVLLVAVTAVSAAAPVMYVKMAGGFGAPAVTTYDVSLDDGPDHSWGTGDESVVVSFRAGQQLVAKEVQVVIDTASDHVVLEGASLGVPLDDVFAAPGTEWTYVLSVPEGADVHVEVVLQRALQEVLMTQDDLTAGTDVYGAIAGSGGAGSGSGGGAGGGGDDHGDDGHGHDDDGDGEGDGEGGSDGEGDHGFTICHIPPGNPGNAHTITVGSQGAVDAHMGHGDYMGPCEDA